jgi:predicted phosphodiesterase
MKNRHDLERVIFVGDVHAPHHDRNAYGLFLRAARDYRPAHLVVLGDFADFYSVSAHEKSAERSRNLEEEVRIVNIMLDELDSLGAKYKVYIAGNHESRMQRYVNSIAPELHGMVTVPKMFQLQERGWEWVEYRDYCMLGKLYMTHDVGASGPNATRAALAAFGHSVVTGHSHRMSYIVEGNAVGEAKVSASFGWMGDIESVEYMHKIKVARDWTLGFGAGKYDPVTGYVYVQPVPIVEGTCVIDGKLYY